MRRGFTLIELLVVIAIIALLASVIIASLGSVQSRARDSRRLDDVNGLQKALALYLTSSGTYPISISTTTINGSDAVTAALKAAEAISAGPQDPTAPTYNYTYSTNAIGNTYLIGFCLETDAIRGYSQGCGNWVRP